MQDTSESSKMIYLNATAGTILSTVNNNTQPHQLIRKIDVSNERFKLQFCERFFL